MPVALFAFASIFAVLTVVWLGTEHWKAAAIDAVAAAVMLLLGVRLQRLSQTNRPAMTARKPLRYLTFLGLGSILLGLAVGWDWTRPSQRSPIPGYVVGALLVVLGLYFLFSAVSYSRRKRASEG